jgi:hypothetical protein
MVFPYNGDVMAKKKDPYDDLEKSIDIQCFIEFIHDGFKEVIDPRTSESGNIRK